MTKLFQSFRLYFTQVLVNLGFFFWVAESKLEVNIINFKMADLKCRTKNLKNVKYSGFLVNMLNSEVSGVAESEFEFNIFKFKIAHGKSVWCEFTVHEQKGILVYACRILECNFGLKWREKPPDCKYPGYFSKSWSLIV